MSGITAHNVIFFSIALSALIFQIIVVTKLWQFRKTLNSFPGAEFLRTVFFVMVGMTAAQAVDVSAATYMLFNGDRIPIAEEAQFAISHAVIVYSMVWAYFRVRSAY